MKICFFHMNARYQVSGLVAEYIIMYYTAHMHTPTLWQMQHNSAQPSFIADTCIYCVLRCALSPTEITRLVLLPLMVSKKPWHWNLCSIQGRNPAYEGHLFSSPLSPYYDHIIANVTHILPWGLSNPDFIGVYLELVHI